MASIGLACGFFAGGFGLDGFGVAGCNGQDGGNSERAFDYYLGQRLRHQLAGANPAIGC
jgi:hypothetical protein